MSRDVLEHLGPTLREWINTWQSTDRGRCIVVMARSSRSQPDLTALSQGPGHHMRTIRHLTHRVIAEVPHDAQGVRDALTERLNPEQNPSARLDRPSPRAPRVSDGRSKSCHSPSHQTRNRAYEGRRLGTAAQHSALTHTGPRPASRPAWNPATQPGRSPLRGVATNPLHHPKSR